MPSYNEQILQSIIDGTPYTNENPYPSKIEVLLMELKEVIESGGGSGGTTNYNLLSNKPTINDVELSANKTSSDLGLQAAISDLETIRSGASAGATAVQPSDMEDALATKVDKVTGKDLSTNDFTDSDKVQILANKAGIGAVANVGAKNMLPITATSGTLNAATVTINDNGSIHIGGQPTSNGAYVISSGIDINIPADSYILSIGSEAGAVKMSVSLRIKGTTQYVDLYQSERRIVPEGAYDRVHIYLYADTTYDVTMYPMIIPVAIEDDTYVPYAPTNRELYEMILALQAGASTNSVQSIASTTELTPRDELF